MMVLSIEVIGQPEIEAKLHDIDEALDTQKILDEGAAVIFNRTRTRFLSEVDPTGRGWIPSQAALKRQRTGKGGGTLFASGKLFRSLQLYADSADSRSIGTDVTNERGFPYPIVHQYGLGQIQRMFLGFNETDEETMLQVVLRRLSEGLQK